MKFVELSSSEFEKQVIIFLVVVFIKVMLGLK